MLIGCPREMEVKALVERGPWPEASPAELIAHASACRPCSDVALVAQALREAHTQAGGPEHAIAPGMIWWRAQLRRRNQAIEQFDRPVFAAHVFALGLALAVTAGFLIEQVRQGAGWLMQLKELAMQEPDLPALWNSALSSPGMAWLAIAALLTCVLIAAASIYLAIEKQ